MKILTILLLLTACDFRPNKEICESVYEQKSVQVTRCTNSSAEGALLDIVMGGDGVVGGIVGSSNQTCVTQEEMKKIRVGEKCEPNPEYYKWLERNSK